MEQALLGAMASADSLAPGGGKGLFDPPPPKSAWEAILRLGEVAAGAFFIYNGADAMGLGAFIVSTVIIVEAGITIEMPPLGVIEAPHAGMAGIFGAAVMAIGLGEIALGGGLIYDGLTHLFP